MFNVSVKGNARCNGIAQAGRGGMVRRNVHVNSSAMPPGGGHSLSDSRLKFSERLKAYLSVDRERSDVSSDAEDPYQFSDGDVCKKVRGMNGAVSRSEVVKSRVGVKMEAGLDTKHSIIDCKRRVEERPCGKPVPGVLRARRGVRGTHHEGSVQRIREEDEAVYQRHWFSRELELLAGVSGGREARLEVVRVELRRQLVQMRRGRSGGGGGAADDVVGEARRHGQPPPPPPPACPPPRPCASCRRAALPCTAHCALHIMASRDQVLFDCCTAKFADNTQCSVPVVDVAHELPLCAEHARKRDNYNKMCAEVRPKKQRRKMKPSAMIRPQRRSKKRKRLQPAAAAAAVVTDEVTTPPPPPTPPPHNIPDDLEHTLVTQASRLLEETDFTTVLNQIPADEFNDLFSDRNGEYEPSMEETEELERALRAVDNDVKSLEKLSQTHGLLDQLLADDSLTADLPDVVFHTAYVTPTPH